MLVIAGGVSDPNIARLAQAAASEDIEHRTLLIGVDANPRLHWDLNKDCLQINGASTVPNSLILRYDIFACLKDPRKEVSQRAMSWFTTLTGYGHAHEGTRMFNKNASQMMGNKPALLVAAKQAGLTIPRTSVSNNIEVILGKQPAESYIAKPVAGGGFCVTLSEAMRQLAHQDGAAASPAIVQSRLDQPEIRIYRIGNEFFAYDMASPDLDYRVKQNATVSQIDAPGDLVKRQEVLMDSVGMDFGAADYKTDSETGELLFLELNSGPMFAHFDKVSNGALCRAMIRYMTR